MAPIVSEDLARALTRPKTEDLDPPPPAVRRPRAYAGDPTVVEDDTPFPAPDLYFRVYESEEDEPDAKYRRDVYKLYDKWLKEHGRRWPENGINTEDLVWLYEEAYREERERAGGPASADAGAGGAGGAGGASSSSAGGKKTRGGKGKNAASGPRKSPRKPTVSIEDPTLQGEFLTDTEDAAAALDQALPKDPAERAAAVAAAKQRRAESREKSGTRTHAADEAHQSEQYERGNLELLYGRYLWDAEGRPAYLSAGRGDRLGGGDDGWHDVYGSVRPRDAASDEVRDALWATDEFESDEDATESEWLPEFVGAGLGLQAEDPFNPQYSLRHSTHPLAPFPGEAIKWASYVYDDGTTFEGLARESVPHGLGVMTFGNGTGAGFHFADVKRGDTYEGEFMTGFAHGLGQLTQPSRGEVFVGEFYAGQRHGCGVRVPMEPLWELVRRGADPLEAYRRTHKAILQNVEFRTWYRGQPLGSDAEDEHVFVAARDDFESPLVAAAKTAVHDQKLRTWASLTPEEKALDRVAAVFERVRRDDGLAVGPESGVKTGLRARAEQRGFAKSGGPGSGYRLPYAKRDGTDNSVDLLLGNTTDGGFGFGWKRRPELGSKVSQRLAAKGRRSRAKEQDDKEAVLGRRTLNPTTGLTIKDYLEGREADYNALLAATLAATAASQQKDGSVTLPSTAAIKAAALGRPQPKQGGAKGIPKGGPIEGVLYPEPDSSEAAADAAFAEAVKKHSASIGKSAALRRAADAALAAETRALGRDFDPREPRNRRAERGVGVADSDTRFETESDVMELCDLAEILGTVEEAGEIVAKARQWRWKPYGEVTLRYSNDARGVPIETLQDPLHYPHGTKFLAPGPLGQCHPIPDDPAVREQLKRAAHNHALVFEQYNLDWDPEPGSAQYVVDQRVRRAQELHERQARRVEDEVVRAEAEEAALARTGAQPGALLAEAAAGAAAAPPLASMSLSAAPREALALSAVALGDASRAVLRTLERAARRAPPRAFVAGGGGSGSSAAAAAAAAAPAAAPPVRQAEQRRRARAARRERMLLSVSDGLLF